MKWENKYNIILDWIDSCKTFEQLTNLIPVVKSQPFPVDDKIRMLDFISLKSSAITIGMYSDELQKLRQLL